MPRLLLLLLLTARAVAALQIAVIGVHKPPGRLAALRGVLHGWEVTTVGTRNMEDVLRTDVEFEHVVVDRTAVTTLGETFLQKLHPRAQHHYIDSEDAAIRTMDGLRETAR